MRVGDQSSHIPTEFRLNYVGLLLQVVMAPQTVVRYLAVRLVQLYLRGVQGNKQLSCDKKCVYKPLHIMF